jgi:Bacterial aa3 type cytochrome c oxidase subunit IV
MAIDPNGGHPAMDYPEHLRTYSGFLRATMILIAFVVVVLLFLLSRVA